MDRIAERDAVSQDVLIDVVRTLEHRQSMCARSSAIAPAAGLVQTRSATSVRC